MDEGNAAGFGGEGVVEELAKRVGVENAETGGESRGKTGVVLVEGEVEEGGCCCWGL